MLLNKFYGVGVLGAIVHKAYIEYLIQAEEQIVGNPQNMLVGVIDALFNQAQNNPFHPASNKWMDKYLPYISFGNAFSNTDVSLLIAGIHILIKGIQVEIKIRTRDPRQKQYKLQVASLFKLALTGVGIVALIAPIFSQEVKK